MKIAACLLLFSTALIAQGIFGSRDPRWQTVGAGALAARPATCAANRSVFICNGAGCGTNGEYHYCTATNTYTVIGGAAGSGTDTVPRTGATDPATCGVGERFFNTTAPGTWKVCSAVNTWTIEYYPVAGAGITPSDSGNSRTLAVDTATMLSRATAQAGDPCVSATGTDALTCNLTPALTAYSDNMCVIFVADAAISGASSCNINALGVRNFKMLDGTDPPASFIPAGMPFQACLDAATPAFILSRSAGGANTALSNLASTAINADLLADADGTRSFGGAANRFNGRLYSLDIGSGAQAAVGEFSLANSTNQHRFGSGFYISGSGVRHAWSSGDPDSDGADSSICRVGVGILGVNDGNATCTTNPRDWQFRHYIAKGTAPTITEAFGTSGSIAGSDAGGRVTVGTGGTDSSGVVTFGTAWATAPACVANNETTTLLLKATATTTTLTLASASAWGAGDLLTWVCVGY